MMLNDVPRNDPTAHCANAPSNYHCKNSHNQQMRLGALACPIVLEHDSWGRMELVPWPLNLNLSLTPATLKRINPKPYCIMINNTSCNDADKYHPERQNPSPNTQHRHPDGFRFPHEHEHPLKSLPKPQYPVQTEPNRKSGT